MKCIDEWMWWDIRDEAYIRGKIYLFSFLATEIGIENAWMVFFYADSIYPIQMSSHDNRIHRYLTSFLDKYVTCIVLPRAQKKIQENFQSKDRLRGKFRITCCLPWKIYGCGPHNVGASTNSHPFNFPPRHRTKDMISVEPLNSR